MDIFLLWQTLITIGQLSFHPGNAICVDESIVQWYALGGQWVNDGLPMYMAVDRKPKNGCEIQNSADGDSGVTEFRQTLQVQSHLEMPRILVQLGHTQRTWKLAPQTDPKWSPTRSSTRYQDQMSVKCTRRTLRMPSFTRAPHAQPSLSNFTRRDSDFGEPTRSRRTTRLE